MIVKTFIVEGMTCKNCKAHVESRINEIAGVHDVIADLANGQVRVSGDDVDNLIVKQMVEDMGYHFNGEIHHHTARSSDVWFS